MRAIRSLLAPAALLLAGCYLSDPVAPPPRVAPPATDGATEPRGPAAVDLDAFDALDADALFTAAADDAVPADLLRAVAWVESSHATLDGGWMGLDAERLARGAFLTGLTEAQLRTDAAANLVAGAALLAELRDDVAPSAHPAEIDAAWWPVLTAWADTGEAWLDDAFALDVFGALQRGVIAPTDRVEDANVLIAPRTVPGLDLLTPDAGPANPAAYPGAVKIGASAPARAVDVARIDLVSAEATWVRALAAPPRGHYVVRASDGWVAEQVADDLEAGAPDAVTVVTTGGVASPGAWTVQALEGSARLVGWLARRHDVPVDSEHIAGELGPHFPWRPWLQMVDCFATGSVGCDSGLAGGVDAGSWPPDGFEEEGGEGRDVPPSVPYFYQYANGLYPSASCQNTSIAMVLKWLGWTGTPDTITSRFGKTLAQSPAGLAQVFNTLASEAGLDARLTPHTDGSVAGLNALLDAGKPTIVHGYMTGYGHVVVVLGRAGSDYVVNDPAGRWAERFMGGYPYGWNGSVGRAIRYPQGAFEAAIATSDGSTYLPLWYHELTGVAVPAADDAPPASEAGSPGDDPDGPAEESEPGAVGGGSEVFYDWADVTWVRPEHGDTVSNPVVMEAERHGGERIEFLAGSWLVGSSVSNPALASREFSQLGPRSLTARNISRWGTLLARSTVAVDVTGHHAAECAVVGTISCGETVAGDTDSASASDVIDGYPGTVGNWSGPEMAWTWSGSSGEVTIRLLDPRPSELNHDILVLRQSAGICVAPDQVAIGWNSLTFSPEPGAAYTFVVDSSGDAGPYQMQLECGD
jgi:hypothetical protein